MKAEEVGVVETLRRYPVKSMLGEEQEALMVRRRGVMGDRAWAVFDTTTGKIASCKRPKLWRDLLSCAGATSGDGTEITLPDGRVHAAGDPDLDRALSGLTGRNVRLIDTPPEGAAIDRAHPEVALAAGLDADVDYSVLVLGGGAPPGTFLDYAPLHLITAATLNSITAALGAEPIEPIRYRPNVIIRSPAGAGRFPENDWISCIVKIGEEVELKVILQTPRCSIPMLAHGTLPPRTDALRILAERNRVDIPGFGDQPCAGVYVAVARDGVIRKGDPVRLGPN